LLLAHDFDRSRKRPFLFGCGLFFPALWSGAPYVCAAVLILYVAAQNFLWAAFDAEVSGPAG
jgi:hypothetical protein